MFITCREYITKHEKKAFVDELVFLCYTPVEEFLFMAGSELCFSLRSKQTRSTLAPLSRVSRSSRFCHVKGVFRVQSKDFVRGKNRTHCVTTRLNDEELEELKRRKGNIPYGVYVRQVLLGRPPKQVPEVNRKAYAETARWASALNQIARKLNMGEDVDISEISRVLSAFRQSLLGIKFGDDDDDHQDQSG